MSKDDEGRPYGAAGRDGDGGSGGPSHPGPGSGQPGQPGRALEPGPTAEPADQPRPAPRYGQYAPSAPDEARYGRYGQYAPSGQQAGPAGGYGQYGGRPVGSVPPLPRGFATGPQPGIIPLRPLNVGEILDGAFRAIRANPKVMFGLSLVVLGIVSVLEAGLLVALLGGAMPFLTDPMAAATASPEEMLAIGAGGLVSAFAAAVALSLASVVLTGLLIISVSQSVLGRQVSAAEVWRQAKGQVWRLIGLTVLLVVGGTVLAVVVLLLMLGGVGALTAALGDETGAILAGLLVLAFVLLLFLALAYFWVRLGLASPALMLERSGVWTAVRRSWSLTRGHFWRIFGSLALAAIIVTVISYALMVPVGIISGLFAVSDTALTASLVVSTVLSTLVSALTTPFLAAVLALVYVDVRMRTEGLDVELARAAGVR